MTKRTLITVIVAAAILTMLPAIAYAFNETGTVDPSITDCVLCHGTSAPGSLETSMTGPHAGYTATSSKCQECHAIHQAPYANNKLLPKETIKDTCNSCHDGSGGNGVYGVVFARTGVQPKAAHGIDETSVVPGGDPDNGGPKSMVFAGAGGKLTCTDCHTPHGGKVVTPFVGDRRRVTTTTVPAASSKLLKTNPAGVATAVVTYGSDWCAACHQGRVNGSMGAINHPVETSASFGPGYFYYGRVARVAGYDPTGSTEYGAMGSNNLGYLMPGWTDNRTAEQTGHTPICQQCHEDPRATGTVTNDGATAHVADYVFTTADGTTAGDNPRFQVFPHESTATAFLVAQPDGLCLDCHPVGRLP